MDLSSMNEFFTVARSDSLPSSARVLKTSKASLSRHIRQLESEPGRPLIDHTEPNRGRVTDFGMLFLRCASQQLQLEQERQATFTSIMNKHDALKTGVCSSLSDSILSVLQRYRQVNDLA